MQTVIINQRFSKAERLCSKKIIEAVIEQGDSLYSHLFRAIFLVNPSHPMPSPAQVAFSVPKRGFRHAVSRNLLKRRMREAYRKNKHLLYQSLAEKESTMAMIIVYRQNTIADYTAIEAATIDLVKKLGEVLSK